jgi:tetratricopeptide (TPR) repeat protein
LAEAANHLRKELPLVERLAQDFNDRPEHQRVLARTLMNLGNVLAAQNQTQDAETFLRQAIGVNATITAKNPEDPQIRLDLAKCHNNLGDLLRKQGDTEGALASFLAARSINEALVKAFPDQPRYSDSLAFNLTNLALVLVQVDPSKVEVTSRAALTIYTKLVADYPENFPYRLGLVRCLRNLGNVLAAADKPKQAEVMYKEALAKLESKDARNRLPEGLRVQADLLNCLADLDLPGAEDAYHRSIALSQSLVDTNPLLTADRHTLAIAQHNLAKFLLEAKRLTEAGPIFAQSVANLEKIAEEAPKAIDVQSHFGIILATYGKWLDSSDKIPEAKTVLTRAVERQRAAVKIGKNGPAYRDLLGGHLIDLAKINLKAGAYDEAGQLALEVPKTVPVSKRAQACFDAARILARLITQAGGDGKLVQADRERLTHNYLGRTIVLLREAIDSSPTLAEQIKTDPDIKPLESRPEFHTIMNTLVNLVGR